jgi:hypothetical protein
MAKPKGRGGLSDDRRNARLLGLAMTVLGIAVAAVAQESSWRTLLLWLVAIALIWGGVTVWVQNRTRVAGKLGRHRFQPPKAGREYGRSVRLAQVPNLPIAEMICLELRSNGIEAFYKGALVGSGVGGGVASANPASLAEVWVGEADLDRARQFLPRVGSASL